MVNLSDTHVCIYNWIDVYHSLLLLPFHRNRSRSLGNVLDHDAIKKHSYVNVKESDSSSSAEHKIRNSALTTAAQKKPPMPLPKPEFLTPQQGETPNKSRHSYESVNMSEVKGNSHPLSSNSTSSM